MQIKRNVLRNCFEEVPINVYDFIKKELVFSGSQKEAARFIGTSAKNVNLSLRVKSKIKKKYIVRYAV